VLPIEADRISFSFYFSAYYFSAEKNIRIFVFFSFFGTKNGRKQTKKESQYFG